MPTTPCIWYAYRRRWTWNVWLAGAVNGTLEIHTGSPALSLGPASLREYRGGPVRCEIRTVAAGEHGCAVPHAEIERQINTPFVQGEGFNPFRFFAVPGPDSFTLGIAYFHAIADAEAIVLLLRDMVLAYLSPRPAATALAFQPLSAVP